MKCNKWLMPVFLLRRFLQLLPNGPRQFSLDEQYESIEPGKVANLLSLDKNPRLKVSNWLSINTIILHGTAIKRSDLAVNGH
ncbi:MAG: hypothetical protein GYB58_05850 [Gammaproteobacteria bacterium]|nr:hypothetical protein [Gammaproteobacteria bacterium]